MRRRGGTFCARLFAGIACLRIAKLLHFLRLADQTQTLFESRVTVRKSKAELHGLADWKSSGEAEIERHPGLRCTAEWIDHRAAAPLRREIVIAGGILHLQCGKSA